MAKQTIVASGITPAYTAVTATDTFPNSGRMMLHIKNASASAVTVTVVAQQTCNHGFQHNLTVSVPASSEKMIGTFPTDRFNDQNGNVTVQYSATASITSAAVELP